MRLRQAGAAANLRPATQRPNASAFNATMISTLRAMLDRKTSDFQFRSSLTYTISEAFASFIGLSPVLVPKQIDDSKTDKAMFHSFRLPLDYFFLVMYA